MKTKDMTLIATMIGILIICSQLALPIGPVPITLQTLGALMIGYLLTPKNALYTTTLYLTMGLIGFPIFSNFTGGFQAILMPSFGFALAFIPATYLQAKYLQTRPVPEMKTLVIAGLINFAIIYLIGLIYMTFILNIYLGSGLGFSGILFAGFIPFIPGDIAKIFVAVVLAKRLLPILNRKAQII